MLIPQLILTGKQRKTLRGVAHNYEPVVQIGKQGVSEPAAIAVDEALTTHELIKVRLHEPEDKRAMANALADTANAALCGLVGHTVILYRPHPDKPRIKL